MMRKLAVLLAVAAVAGGAPAAAAPKNPVKVTSPKNAKGIQRVVIGQVAVGFLVERKDSAKAGGGLMGNGMGGRSTTRSTLAGYTPADLQAVADAAYVDLEEKLRSAGFELVDRAALTADPKLAKTKSQPAPYELSVVTGRDDKARVLFVPSTQTAPLRMIAGDAVVGGLSAMGMTMNGSQVAMAMSEHAKASGAHVVTAIYYVDFADSEEYGGWFRSSSAVKVRGSLALLPDQTRISVFGPGYKTAYLALANPVAVGGDFFEGADTTSGGEKASQTIANVIGVLGGVGTNSSKRLTFTARPGSYAPGATQAVQDANALLVPQLAALR